MVDPQACIGCSRCVRELGCPALTMENKKAKIEPDMCYGLHALQRRFARLTPNGREEEKGKVNICLQELEDRERC